MSGDKLTSIFVKQLRSDARRASLVARHLRFMADEIAGDARRQGRAEIARTNFYSKQAEVDKSIALIPGFEEKTERG